MILSFIIGILSLTLDIVYWLKWIAAYLTILIFKRFHRRRFDLYDSEAVNNPIKLGYLVPQVEIDLESPLPESHLKAAADEVFFYGVNSKSECVICRIARGCNQEAEAWVYVKLADGRIYQLADTFGYQQTYGDKCLTFSCGGLQMYYLSPMRRWRIFYSGMLKDTTHELSYHSRMTFVKFSFLWKASSDVYDASSDFSPRTTASALANVKWEFPFFPPLFRLTEIWDLYCQSGFITGTVSINENPDHEMCLFGEKLRYLGKNNKGCKFTHIMGNTPENGLIFHVGNASIADAFEKLPFGFVVQSDGEMKIADNAHIISKLFSVDKSLTLSADFTAGRKYELLGDIVCKPILLKSGTGWRGYLELRYIEFELKNFKGSGVLMFGEILTEPERKITIQASTLPKAIPTAVRFTDDISHCCDITGGKGSSLGMLTKLSLEDKTFIVPKGIVVTTAALSEFITSEISAEIKSLEDIAYGNAVGDLHEACKKIANIIVNTPIPNKICNDIESHLSAIFDGKINEHKLAVRSSATGEDTDQMSAAGQMDTFLGVQGLKEIFLALKKCWASQFGYIAVEYKRRNGQMINSPMAVVIQEMVHSEVSGVLFTCDPVTNNPSQITITGNYGLGESVVSGSEEPDTIILERRPNNQVIFKSNHIGAKHHKIIVQENGGTVTEDVPENERNECCLSNAMAEKLGNLAIRIEIYYKSPRDIEWGIKNGVIYILQSRPVTSGCAETEFEIKHEFDAPLRCELEYFTICNVGEVMPGATSPLGIDFLEKYFSTVFKKEKMAKRQVNNFMQNKYYPIGIVPFYNHMMMSVVDLLSRVGDMKTLEAQGMAIGIFGRILDEPELFSVSEERVTKKPKKTIRSYFEFIWDIFFLGYQIPKVKERIDNYNFPVGKCKSSEEVFNAIMSSCSDLEEALETHFMNTEISSVWNIYLFILLSKAKGTIDTDVYSDFARFLASSSTSSSSVESADVPSAIQDLAHWISKDMKCEDFKAMSVEEAENCLLTSKSVSGYKFRTFLKRHGHRCLKEFDVHSITWGIDSKPLIKLLQNLAGAAESVTTEKDHSIDKIFSELHTPLDFRTRLFLRFLLPNVRRGVRNREAGKSILIKAIDNWRKAFRYLGKRMVAEGRIPDVDLIFFFTIDEIQDFLQSRSPKILARANHRRKMHPTLDAYMFPDIMKGVPIPINEQEQMEEEEFTPDLVMKGIPVSQGVTRGTARVALTLEEASHLKPGEILITFSTDIGWSPYFPILSGVVTELGGLISHGAVVSREYGLPCVVGLHGATRKFRTGDNVLLDGTKGVLQRLPKPESNSS